MRRFLACVVTAGFLGLVGLQSFHRHAKAPASESCQLCVLGAQTVRHAAARVDAPTPDDHWIALARETAAAARFVRPVSACSRAPPSGFEA